MKVNPIGMLWMMPAGRRNRLLAVAWRALRALPQGHLMTWTNKFTLLDDAVRGIGGAAAEGQVGEAGQQRQLLRLYDVGDERRRLFGVGEGPAEAVAGAKQDAWNGSTQAGVRNRMRNNDLRLRFAHASATLRSAS